MFTVIIVCLLFLAPNGDLICRCEEQIQSKPKPAVSRPSKDFRPAIESTTR